MNVDLSMNLCLEKMMIKNNMVQFLQGLPIIFFRIKEYIMKICEYGCEQEAKFQFKNGKWCCSKNHKQCPAKRKTNKDYSKNKSYKIVNCQYCLRELFFSNLKVHERACTLNPKNIKRCPNCNKIIIKLENKFCSRSCSASYNNKKRKHSEESKRKISESVKKFLQLDPLILIDLYLLKRL